MAKRIYTCILILIFDGKISMFSGKKISKCETNLYVSHSCLTFPVKISTGLWNKFTFIINTINITNKGTKGYT